MITTDEIREELILAATSYMLSAIEAADSGAKTEADMCKVRADLCNRFLEEWFGETLENEVEMRILQDLINDI